MTVGTDAGGFVIQGDRMATKKSPKKAAKKAAKKPASRKVVKPPTKKAPAKKPASKPKPKPKTDAATLSARGVVSGNPSPAEAPKARAVADLTQDELRKLGNKLDGTSNNVFAVLKAMYGIDADGDEIFDRLKTDGDACKCELCDTWKLLVEFPVDSDICKTCDSSTAPDDDDEESDDDAAELESDEDGEFDEDDADDHDVDIW